jgi:hypothetical protein
MAGSKKRLELVENKRKMGEARLAREALTYLSDEDLEALADVFVVGQEKAGERGRRAVEVLNEVIDALREGREPRKGEAR